MKKKIKLKLLLLILTAIFLYSSSITPQTIAQDESITIGNRGCSSCNQEQNLFFVEWTYTGTITDVSIYYYNLSMTTIEYTITPMTANNGSYEWNMPASHQLDGEYYLVVCDYSDNLVNDSVLTEVYPIQSFTPAVPGYPIFFIGLIIGITCVITVIPLTNKLRKR